MTASGRMHLLIFTRLPTHVRTTFPSMLDDALRPATRDDVRDALGYALRFTRTGKAHRHATEMMARIAADVLVEHLELSGFVVMRKPPALAPSTTPLMPLKG